MSNDKINEKVAEITRLLIDKGRLMEAGFVLFRHQCIPADASDIQIREMRKAFFAGAQHLHGSIMAALDPGTEPTEKDMIRMDQIYKELMEFSQEMKRAAESRN
jgi:hypothetical protein